MSDVLQTTTSPTSHVRSFSSLHLNTPTVASPTRGPSLSCNDLLEPITQEDEHTIRRLISLQHTRSFTMCGDPTTDALISGTKEQQVREQELYTAQQAQIINSLLTNGMGDDASDCGDDDDAFFAQFGQRSDPDALEQEASKIQQLSFVSKIHGDRRTRPSTPHINKSSSNNNNGYAIVSPEQTPPMTTTVALTHTPRGRIQRDKTPMPVFDTNDDMKATFDHFHVAQHAFEFETMGGHLEKKSASKFVGWQPRWFYLWEHTLDYYKESSLHARGTINLRDVAFVRALDDAKASAAADKEKEKEKEKQHFGFQIAMKNNGRIYGLRTYSEHDRHEWIRVLQHNMSILQASDFARESQRFRGATAEDGSRNGSPTLRSHSIGCCLSTYTRSSPNPGKNQSTKPGIFRRSPLKNNHPEHELQHGHGGGGDTRMRTKSLSSASRSSTTHLHDLQSQPQQQPQHWLTYDDVCSHGNNGDILLFRSRSSAGGIVRCCTNGDYDHVGIILRLKNGALGVLEALGAGVQVFLWSNFAEYHWYRQYPRIALRSLQVADPRLRRDIDRKLNRFVKTVIHRQYGWNPMHLVRRTSALSLDDEKRTFFCSELIAKAYKECGLLRPDFVTSRYFPCHFQQSKALKLLKGCSFSNEMEVVWDEQYVGGAAQTHSQPHSQRERSHSLSCVGRAHDVHVVKLQASQGKPKKARRKSPPPPLPN